MRRGSNHFYRLIHDDNIIDGLAIATVEHLSTKAGVDTANLVQAPAEPAA